MYEWKSTAPADVPPPARPIERLDLLVAILNGAFACRSALAATTDVKFTVKSAVEAWIDADRAYQDYVKELSDTAQEGR